MSGATYDRIGVGYAGRRRSDPRIAAQIEAAVLGPDRPSSSRTGVVVDGRAEAVGAPRTVVNVGAGTGSYELGAPVKTVALEPSSTMQEQRPPGSAPCVAGVAGALPFGDQVFDVATAILTVHHWRDPDAGLREMQRVAARQVILTFDPSVHDRLWLMRDYLPESAARRASRLPTPDEVLARLGGGRVEIVPVPADCTDGFFWAWWQRPQAYLDPGVRQSISGLANLPADVVEPAMGALAADLSSGRWHERNADLLHRTEIDGGYRLVVTG